ncbi:DUF1115 domain protein [Apodospora peruviana]|uniref:DUF1115 domain protein n=1 Tax=Apodospora peruviana TaxID=516989 RepID=A0AAE0HU06_9PEZI|nr:DUF1115 domain protein [Apodospora peruviana]
MSQDVLPRDLIELQLAQIDLLVAMYPDEGAISMNEASSAALDALRRTWDDIDPELIIPNVPSSVSVLLTLDVVSAAEDKPAVQNKTFQLEITFPFTYHHTGEEKYLDDTEPPRPKIRLVQPSWMNKAETAALMANIPKDSDSDDLFATIEKIQDITSSHVRLLSSTSTVTENEDNTAGKEDVPITRVWFYFPSISTRSKRDDIVNHAPSYQLTGFLLSGKPGILCLEGASDRVDAYMRFIKTESWGDIPAHQKKVSERFREVGVVREFPGMEEITDILGDRRGERANRGDMKALEAWLVERGLGEAFTKVLI